MINSVCQMEMWKACNEIAHPRWNRNSAARLSLESRAENTTTFWEIVRDYLRVLSRKPSRGQWMEQLIPHRSLLKRSLQSRFPPPHTHTHRKDLLRKVIIYNSKNSGNSTRDGSVGEWMGRREMRHKEFYPATKMSKWYQSQGCLHWYFPDRKFKGKQS